MGTFVVGVDTVVFVLDCILSHCLLLVEGLGVGFKSSIFLVEFLTIIKIDARAVHNRIFVPCEIYHGIACATRCEEIE